MGSLNRTAYKNEFFARLEQPLNSAGFIVTHLLWHGISVFLVYHRKPPHEIWCLLTRSLIVNGSYNRRPRQKFYYNTQTVVLSLSLNVGRRGHFGKRLRWFPMRLNAISIGVFYVASILFCPMVPIEYPLFYVTLDSLCLIWNIYLCNTDDKLYLIEAHWPIMFILFIKLLKVYSNILVYAF